MKTKVTIALAVIFAIILVLTYAVFDESQKEKSILDHCKDAGYENFKWSTEHNLFYCTKTVPSETGLGVDTIKSGLIEYDEY